MPRDNGRAASAVAGAAAILACSWSGALALPRAAEERTLVRCEAASPGTFCRRWVSSGAGLGRVAASEAGAILASPAGVPSAPESDLRDAVGSAASPAPARSFSGGHGASAVSLPRGSAGACLPPGTGLEELEAWEGAGRGRMSSGESTYAVDRIVLPEREGFRQMSLPQSPTGGNQAIYYLRSPALWGDLCEGYAVSGYDTNGDSRTLRHYTVPASANPKLCGLLAAASGGKGRPYPAGRVLQMKVLVPPGITTVAGHAGNHGAGTRLWGFTRSDDPTELAAAIEAFGRSGRAPGWCSGVSAEAYGGCYIELAGDASRPRWLHYNLVLPPDSDVDNAIELGEIGFAFTGGDAAAFNAWKRDCGAGVYPSK